MNALIKLAVTVVMIALAFTTCAPAPVHATTPVDPNAAARLTYTVWAKQRQYTNYGDVLRFQLSLTNDVQAYYLKKLEREARLRDLKFQIISDDRGAPVVTLEIEVTGQPELVTEFEQTLK